MCYLFHAMEDLWPGRSELQEISPRVFIGSFFSVRKTKLLRDAGITHVLNVTHDLPFPATESGVSCCRIGFSDDATRVVLPLQQCLLHIDTVLQESPQHRVVVHCAAGSSRSGAIVVAWVMQKKKCSLDEALKEVQALRPVVLPNPGFMEQLKDFEEKLQKGVKVF